MNKESTIEALQIIQQIIGDTPAVPLDGRVTALSGALARLKSEVKDDPYLRAESARLYELVESNYFARDAGKPNRNLVLTCCEGIMQRIDPAIGPPHWGSSY